MTTRFNGPIGAELVEYKQQPPTAAQIAATGAALPAGPQTLTKAQQRAWFGTIVFTSPVSWDGEAFVSGSERLTPEQVAARQGGR